MAEKYLTIALAKGRLAELSVEIFMKLGYDCAEMLTKTRKLIFTDEARRVKFLLVKAGDVPTYVEYGAADIGIVGRDTILEEGRKNERAEILSKLSKGMRLKGKVSSIVDFGAFVDLGGIDGLVHISELSWNHVNHPSEVVKVGQEIEVLVLDVDTKRERISLGYKQTTEDPWRTLVKRYPVGAIVEGTVTKLVPFGAFVDLGDGIEGLVHISEMARQHVDAPAQVAHVGDKVQVKVMEIDLNRRRISLSMKSAAETLGIEVEVRPLAPGDEVSRPNRPQAAPAGEPVPETEPGADEAAE